MRRLFFHQGKMSFDFCLCLNIFASRCDLSGDNSSTRVSFFVIKSNNQWIVRGFSRFFAFWKSIQVLFMTWQGKISVSDINNWETIKPTRLYTEKSCCVRKEPTKQEDKNNVCKVLNFLCVLKLMRCQCMFSYTERFFTSKPRLQECKNANHLTKL